MTEERKPTLEIRPPAFPNGYMFPEELLQKWIDIPDNEPLTIGHLTKPDIDQLLFSISDLSRSIAELRVAFLQLSRGDQANADAALQNSFNAATDAETRNRLLFKAIIESILKVRDATK